MLWRFFILTGENLFCLGLGTLGPRLIEAASLDSDACILILLLASAVIAAYDLFIEQKEKTHVN